jgi:uncharacterized metal-binding protein YceD (DUF177 family)
VDVDDVRHLVVAGHAAPWEGDEGIGQQRLGVLNACDLVRSFMDSAIEVVVADVLTPATLALYRERLPRCLVLRLTASLPVVLQRAATRTVGLTQAQVRARHQAEADDPPVADETIDVTTLNAREQVEAVERIWRGA